MASSLKQHFDDDLSCPVCLENFVDGNIPKDLDCPHVCCLPCLNQMSSNIIGAIKCPQCQKITTIPAGGVPALRTNLRVRSMAEKLKEYRQANREKMCTTHEEHEIFFFCITCSTAICQYCIVNDHLNHKFEPIKSMVSEQKQKLRRAVQKVQTQIEKGEANYSHLVANEESLLSQFTEAEVKIDTRIQAGIDELKSQGRELKDRLQRLRKNKLEELGTQLKSNQNRLVDKRAVFDKAQALLDQPSNVTYMKDHEKSFNELKMLIEDESTSWNRVSQVHSGFELEMGSMNINLKMNLKPRAAASDSGNDVPSTSSEGSSSSSQGGKGPQKRAAADLGDHQSPTSSTKRSKSDEEEAEVILDDSGAKNENNDDDDVCYVSLSESDDEDAFFDLT